VTGDEQSTPDPRPEPAGPGAPAPANQADAAPAHSSGGAPVDPPGAAATGHPAVDEALRALDDAADAPPADQIPAYEAAHHVLQQTLATIDES
jgi:hypothetical protein